jgi:hypothetical protein
MPKTQPPAHRAHQPGPGDPARRASPARQRDGQQRPTDQSKRTQQAMRKIAQRQRHRATHSAGCPGWNGWACPRGRHPAFRAPPYPPGGKPVESSGHASVIPPPHASATGATSPRLSRAGFARSTRAGRGAYGENEWCSASRSARPWRRRQPQSAAPVRKMNQESRQQRPRRPRWRQPPSGYARHANRQTPATSDGPPREVPPYRENTCTRPKSPIARHANEPRTRIQVKAREPDWTNERSLIGSRRPVRAKSRCVACHNREVSNVQQWTASTAKATI